MTNWKIWLKGLVASVIQSSATGVSVVIADPNHFADFNSLWPVMLASGLVGGALYLAKSPIWD